MLVIKRYCCIPGCLTTLTKRNLHCCTKHWREYKDYPGAMHKERPDLGQKIGWLRALINSQERETYFQERIAPRLRSLDTMLEFNQMQVEEMEIYRGMGRIPRSAPKNIRKQKGVNTPYSLDSVKPIVL